VQLPLRRGDAAFFNPAVLHGAGSNVSADIQRVATLLQVSSGFGRAMEYVDRVKVAKAVYPALKRRQATGADPDALVNAVAAVAEGYPCPTNLDRDQPVDGLTPHGPDRDPGSGTGRGLDARPARRGPRRVRRSTEHRGHPVTDRPAATEPLALGDADARLVSDDITDAGPARD
jgi:hypothetical protein